MGDEIKEILNKYLNGLISYPFQEKDKEYILDCITNLQQELENKNNEIDVLKDQVEWWKQQCDDLEMQIGEQNE